MNGERYLDELKIDTITWRIIEEIHFLLYIFIFVRIMISVFFLRAISVMYLLWWSMLNISVSRFILKKAILFIYGLLKWTSNFRFTWHSQKALFSIFIFEKNQRCIQSKFFSGITIYYQWMQCITWTPIPKKGNAKLFQCNVLSLTSFAWR